MKKAFGLLSVLLIWVGQVSATTYLIDFGLENAQTSISGTYWNNLTARAESGVTYLNPRSGNLTLQNTSGSNPLQMSYAYPTGNTDWDGMNAFQQTISNPLPNLGLLDESNAKSDGIWSKGPVSFVLSGLDQGKTYDFTLFGHRVNSPQRTTEYRVQGADGVVSQIINVATTVDNGGEPVIFESVRPNALGEIELTLIAGLGEYTYLNAMQIVVVPEPGKGALAGLSVLGCA